MKFWLALFLMVLAGSAAVAQPRVNSKVSDVMAMGSGKSLALPAGAWEVKAFKNISGNRSFFESYLLENLDPASSTPYVIIAEGTANYGWSSGSGSLYDVGGFLQDLHGTAVTQMLTKLSAAHVLDGRLDLPSLRNVVNEFRPLLSSVRLPGLANGRFVLADVRYVQLKNALTVLTFVRLPEGVNARQLQSDHREGVSNATNAALSQWLTRAVGSVQQSYFEKQPPQPLAQLFAAPVTAVAQAPGGPVVSALPATSPRAEPPLAEVFAAVRERQAALDKAQRDAEQSEQIAARERERFAALIAAKAKQDEAAQEAQRQARARQLEEERLRLAEDNRQRELQRQQAEVRAREAQQAAADTRVREQAAVAQAAEQAARLLAQQKAREQAQEQARLAESRAAESRAKELKASADALKAKEEQYARLQAELDRLKGEMAPKPAAAAWTPGKKALVIGNNRYRSVSPLANAVEDARAMADNLAQVGFVVTLKLDLSQQEMKAAIRSFKAQVGPGDEVTFFYAGHGVQIGQSNFLLPVDITGEGEEQIRDDAVPLDRVLDDMSEKKVKFTLALVDACRDNPFKVAARSLGSRGLAPSNTATGQMVVFSAGAGQQALDRLGDNDREKNGLFTRVFLKEMHKPGISIDRVVRNVRSQVVQLAKSVGHDQVPAIYDQVVGEYFFRP